MDYIQIGKINNTHGIKGELKISSFSSFPKERFCKDNDIYILINNEYKKVKISSVRFVSKFILITIDNLYNINDVIKYKNLDVFIKKDTLLPLEQGYYYVDIIGLNLVEDNKIVGKVIDIIEVMQGLILEVTNLKNEIKQIPYVDEYIKKVDLDNKCIIIKTIEGLL